MIHIHNDNNDKTTSIIKKKTSSYLTPVHTASHPTGELEKGFEKEEMEMFSCQQVT